MFYIQSASNVTTRQLHTGDRNRCNSDNYCHHNEHIQLVAILIGTIDLNHLKQLSVALILAEGHKVSRKQNFLAHFSIDQDEICCIEPCFSGCIKAILRLTITQTQVPKIHLLVSMKGQEMGLEYFLVKVKIA